MGLFGRSGSKKDMSGAAIVESTMHSDGLTASIGTVNTSTGIFRSNEWLAQKAMDPVVQSKLSHFGAKPFFRTLDARGSKKGRQGEHFFEQGRALHAKGNADGASVFYRKCLEMNTSHADCLCAYALLNLEQKNLNGAEMLYRNAYERHDTDPAVCFNFAAFLHVYQPEKHEEAMNLYKHCSTLDKNFTMALYNMAHLRYTRSEWTGCLQCYEKILQIDEKHIEARLNAAGLYSVLYRDFEKARKYYNMALDLAPAHPLGLYHYSQMLIDLEEMEEAISSLKKLIKAHPDHSWGIASLADHMSRARDPSADSLWERALSINQSSSTLYIGYARHIMRGGKGETSNEQAIARVDQLKGPQSKQSQVIRQVFNGELDLKSLSIADMSGTSGLAPSPAASPAKFIPGGNGGVGGGAERQTLSIDLEMAATPPRPTKREAREIPQSPEAVAGGVSLRGPPSPAAMLREKSSPPQQQQQQQHQPAAESLPGGGGGSFAQSWTSAGNSQGVVTGGGMGAGAEAGAGASLSGGSHETSAASLPPSNPSSGHGVLDGGAPSSSGGGSQLPQFIPSLAGRGRGEGGGGAGVGSGGGASTVSNTPSVSLAMEMAGSQMPGVADRVQPGVGIC